MGNRLIIPTAKRYAPAPVPWNPAQISPEAWYDASAQETITEAGGAVSQWDDISGNGNHLAGGVAPTTKSRTQNGLNLIEFTPTDYLDTSSGFFDPIDDMSIFVVYLDDDPAGGSNGVMIQNLSNGVGGTGRSVFFRFAGATDYMSTFIGGARTNFYTTDGNFNLVALTFDEHDVSDLDIDSYLNGTAEGSVDNLTAETNLNSDIRIGATASAGLGWDGVIGEIVIFQTLLSLADRQKMEGYLAWKWGLTANLDVSHPYKTTPPYR